MNLSKFFLVRPIIPLLSPLIYMQSWQRTVKLLGIHSCRGEENTSDSGHSSMLHSYPSVCLRCPQSTAKAVCVPWTLGGLPQHGGGDHWNEKYQAHIPDFSISKHGWALSSTGYLFVWAAQKDLMYIWCAVLIFCHRSLGNIKVSICNHIQRSWFSEQLEKVNAALSWSAGLWGDLVERCRSPKGLGKRGLLNIKARRSKYRDNLYPTKNIQKNFTWPRCYCKNPTLNKSKVVKMKTDSSCYQGF